jgi:hypothetical protein
MQVEKFQNAKPAVAQNNASLQTLMESTKALSAALGKAQGFQNKKEHFQAAQEPHEKKETFMGANGDAMAPSMEGFQNQAPALMPVGPANCYPKNQLAPQDLLPADPNSKWAEVNPTGAGDISGKNFLGAGALIGVNTVGQSLRNANQQLRSEPPCPQAQVSIWNQSTIEPDLQRRPLEGF